MTAPPTSYLTEAILSRFEGEPPIVPVGASWKQGSWSWGLALPAKSRLTVDNDRKEEGIVLADAFDPYGKDAVAAAFKLGQLRAGDVIAAVNGKTITSKQFKKKLKADGTLKLLVKRELPQDGGDEALKPAPGIPFVSHGHNGSLCDAGVQGGRKVPPSVPPQPFAKRRSDRIASVTSPSSSTEAEAANNVGQRGSNKRKVVPRAVNSGERRSARKSKARRQAGGDDDMSNVEDEEDSDDSIGDYGKRRNIPLIRQRVTSAEDPLDLCSDSGDEIGNEGSASAPVEKQAASCKADFQTREVVRESVSKRPRRGDKSDRRRAVQGDSLARLPAPGSPLSSWSGERRSSGESNEKGDVTIVRRRSRGRSITDTASDRALAEALAEDEGGANGLTAGRARRKRRRKARVWPSQQLVATPFGLGIVVSTQRDRKGNDEVQVALFDGLKIFQPDELSEPPISPSSLLSNPSKCESMTTLNNASHHLCWYPYPASAHGSIDLRNVDLLRLSPGVYLNDNLIEFYLKYLQQAHVSGETHSESSRTTSSSPSSSSSSPTLSSSTAEIKVSNNSSIYDDNRNLFTFDRSKFYIYAPFFFTKVKTMLIGGGTNANTEKGAAKQRNLWQGVRRWTRDLEGGIFATDFLVVPINQNEHWSVAIICNAGSLDPIPEVDESEENAGDVEEVDVSAEWKNIAQCEAAMDATESTERRGLRRRQSSRSLSGASSEVTTGATIKKEKNPSEGDSEAHEGSQKKNKNIQDKADESRHIFSRDEGKIQEIEANQVATSRMPGGNNTMESAVSAATESGASSNKSIRDPSLLRPRPCIIHLDSARLHKAAGIHRYLRSYLQLAWNATRAASHGPRIFDSQTMPCLSPRVPQQDNDCDCGVFLLHFVEKFVFKPPRVDGAFIESKGAPLVQPITAPPPTQPLTESSMEPIRASQTDEVCQDTKEILKDAAVFQAEVNLSHDVFPAEVTLNNGEEGAPAVQAKPKKNVRATKVQKPPEPCWFPMSDIKEKRGAIKKILMDLAETQRRMESM